MTLKMQVEWQPALEIRAPEIRATWCRLEVIVEGRSVTLLEDRNGATRRSIFVSAYPLAEWIAYNWFQLRFDGRPNGIPQVAWGRLGTWGREAVNLSAHNLRSAGEGYPWPDLTLVPDGNLTHVSWRESPQVLTQGIRYVTSGSLAISSADVQAALTDFVEQTLTRLSEAGVLGTALESEWTALRKLDQDQVAYCEALARLGEDPFDADDRVAELVLRAAAELPDDLLSDFLDATAPSAIEADISWYSKAEKALREVKSPRRVADLAAISKMMSALRDLKRPDMPWIPAREAAQRLRAEVSSDPREPFNIEDFVGYSYSTGGGRGVQALGTRTAGCRVIANHGRSESGRRFMMARALWWGVVHPAEPEFLLTRASTYHQRAARAFAAELLAPSEGIASLVSEAAGVVEYSEVSNIARRYKVDPITVEHQLTNNVGILAAY